MKLMEMDYELAPQYIELGFSVSKFGEKSYALKHQDLTIFVFSSELEFRKDFISQLCDSYLILAKGVINKSKRYVYTKE